jgi:hypothetical protein
MAARSRGPSIAISRAAANAGRSGVPAANSARSGTAGWGD